MGLTSTDAALPAGGAALAPLSRDRVRAHLDAQGWPRSVAGSDELWGVQGQHGIWFLLRGEPATVLLVQARYNRRIPADQLGRVQQIADAWARRHPWPLVHAVPEATGELAVLAQHAVEYPEGLSDARLADHVSRATRDALAFFDHLDVSYPEAVAEARGWFRGARHGTPA